MKRVRDEFQNIITFTFLWLLLLDLKPVVASPSFNPINEMKRFVSVKGCNEQLQALTRTEHQIGWHTILQNLNALKRSGWLRRNIPREIAESVLEHSWKLRIATITFGNTRPEINIERAELMAIVHDVAEIITGDHTPADNVLPGDKYANELAALKSLVAQFGDVGDDMVSAWMEFEAAQTVEAMLVTQLDKLDAAVQAVGYARQGYPVRDIYDYTRQRIQDPKLLGILEQIISSEHSAGDTYELYFRLLGR